MSAVVTSAARAYCAFALLLLAVTLAGVDSLFWLMALLFYSSRHGYDEQHRADSERE